MLSSLEIKRQTFNNYLNCATNKQVNVRASRISGERIL